MFGKNKVVGNMSEELQKYDIKELIDFILHYQLAHFNINKNISVVDFHYIDGPELVDELFGYYSPHKRDIHITPAGEKDLGMLSEEIAHYIRDNFFPAEYVMDDLFELRHLSDLFSDENCELYTTSISEFFGQLGRCSVMSELEVENPIQSKKWITDYIGVLNDLFKEIEPTYSERKDIINTLDEITYVEGVLDALNPVKTVDLDLIKDYHTKYKSTFEDMDKILDYASESRRRVLFSIVRTDVERTCCDLRSSLRKDEVEFRPFFKKYNELIGHLVGYFAGDVAYEIVKNDNIFNADPGYIHETYIVPAKSALKEVGFDLNSTLNINPEDAYCMVEKAREIMLSEITN